MQALSVKIGFMPVVALFVLQKGLPATYAEVITVLQPLARAA
jgi:hypothetical protein